MKVFSSLLFVCLFSTAITQVAWGNEDESSAEGTSATESTAEEKVEKVSCFKKYTVCMSNKTDCGEGESGAAAQKKHAACVRACLAEKTDCAD